MTGVGGSINLPQGHFKFSTLAVLSDLVLAANSASNLASSSAVMCCFTGQQYSSKRLLSRKLDLPAHPVVLRELSAAYRFAPSVPAFALITGHSLTLGLLLPISLLIACIVFSAQYPKRYSQRFAPDWAAAQAAKQGL